MHVCVFFFQIMLILMLSIRKIVNQIQSHMFSYVHNRNKNINIVRCEFQSGRRSIM